MLFILSLPETYNDTNKCELRTQHTHVKPNISELKSNKLTRAFKCKNKKLGQRATIH